MFRISCPKLPSESCTNLSLGWWIRDLALDSRSAKTSKKLCCFFQAEDGIRDYKVTGVQACALPISPVAQPDPDVADELPWIVDGRIQLVAHPGGDAEHFGVAHGLVLELGEARPPLDEDHGDEIRQAELRGVPVPRRLLRRQWFPETIHRSGRGAASDVRDLVGPESVELAEAERAVHVRVRDRAAGVGLEREPFELPLAAEAGKELPQAPRIEAAREGAIEAVLALKDRLRPRKAGLREQSRDDARVSRPSGVEPLGP